MLQFKLKAMRLKPDFTSPILAGVLAGKDKADLEVNLEKLWAEGLEVCVFV
jgi:predicted hydrocarbon binding protein